MSNNQPIEPSNPLESMRLLADIQAHVYGLDEGEVDYDTFQNAMADASSLVQAAIIDDDPMAVRRILTAIDQKGTGYVHLVGDCVIEIGSNLSSIEGGLEENRESAFDYLRQELVLTEE